MSQSSKLWLFFFLIFCSIEFEAVLLLILETKSILFDDEGQVSLEGLDLFIDISTLEPVVSRVCPEMSLELDSGMRVGESSGCIFIF